MTAIMHAVVLDALNREVQRQGHPQDLNHGLPPRFAT